MHGQACTAELHIDADLAKALLGGGASATTQPAELKAEEPAEEKAEKPVEEKKSENIGK